MVERICKNCACCVYGNLKKVFCSTKCKTDFTNSKAKLNIEPKNCCICGSLFAPSKHFNKNVCSDSCKQKNNRNKRDVANNKKAKQNIVDSIDKFKDADPYTYTECNICGMRSGHLGYHIKKIHGISSDEYKKTYNSEICSQQYSDNHSGANNPAYNHGGKFSPFSKNFLKYDGLSDSDKEHAISETVAASNQTKENNPERNPLKVEFYMNQGMSLREAELALSERQTTFSLEICIHKHGEFEGTRIWKERQDKWIATLNNKSPEEIAEINKKKATFTNYGLIGSGAYSNVSGLLYIIKLPNSYLKFGITSRSVDKRYTKLQMTNCEVLYEMNGDLETIAKIESILKSKYSNNIILKEEQHSVFGYSETVSNIDVFDITNYIESLTIEEIEEEYLWITQNQKL